MRAGAETKLQPGYGRMVKGATVVRTEKQDDLVDTASR